MAMAKGLSLAQLSQMRGHPQGQEGQGGGGGEQQAPQQQGQQATYPPQQNMAPRGPVLPAGGEGGGAAPPGRGGGGSGTTSATSGSVLPQRIPASRRLQSLLSEVDPSYRLDEEAAEVVLHLVEDFMNSVATHSAQLARHRGAQAIEHRDVAFTLSKQWGMPVPPVIASSAAGGGGVTSQQQGGGGVAPPTLQSSASQDSEGGGSTGGRRGAKRKTR